LLSIAPDSVSFFAQRKLERVTEQSDKTQKAVALDGNARAATPSVLASGSGSVARQILDIAFAHGIKVREDADLVEILATLDIGDQIPIAALAAVAEILSHVYQWEVEQQSRSATGTAP
jgi:flagellar biosynthesis protein